MGAKNSCEISRLPQDCLTRIISLTSPRDACCCSAVSTNFQLAADADAVWEHFLPPDLDHILSRTEDQLVFTSKKDLYFLLSNRDIILDDGKMSFRLDRSSGAKIYMLSASRSAISIIWGDNPQYWQRVSPNRDSRFSEVARLIIVWWLKMSTRFSCKILTPKTNYTAYFVFKLEDDSSGLDLPIDALIDFGEQESRHKICLQPRSSSTRQTPNNAIRYPRVRDDGWSEVEIGEFYNDCEDDDEIVELDVREVNGLWAKRGLIFYGIEIRPKK
ncbi:putative F-box protein PP2-B12 [Carex littledalei]|uniref:Putative F-box protein PP2-B12 n=1 Tax=Carex littledalei TaxID=544730 RepID=A0A833RN74_9POAL|nr:putative F-box protein PP2-B12 [Carex littledalei]